MYLGRYEVKRQHCGGPQNGVDERLSPLALWFSGCSMETHQQFGHCDGRNVSNVSEACYEIANREAPALQGNQDRGINYKSQGDFRGNGWFISR